MRNFISEDDIEQAILSKLKAEPFKYDILVCDADPSKRDDLNDSTGRLSKKECILPDVMLSSLKRINSTIPEEKIKEIVKNLRQDYTGTDIVDTNYKIYRQIRNNIKITVRRNGKEEFDFVKRYIEIMKVRFGERLEFNDNISEDVKEVSVPKMVIQPIVENAVKYGFGEDVEVLRVEISAYIENEKLYIIVKDDGVGIEEDLLKDLVFNLKEKYNSSDHIGLYNVHKRIELLYGIEYGLEINSEAGKGTEVILVLPEIFE